MKKIIIFLSALMMIVSLSACSGESKDEPVGPVVNPVKEVTSVADFKELGLDVANPNLRGADSISYSIVNDEIAQINFNYSNHNYTYRISKVVASGAILGISDTPVKTVESSYNDIIFTVHYFADAMGAIWQKNGVDYSLYCEGVSDSEAYEFCRIAGACFGLELNDDDLIELPEINKDMTREAASKWFFDNNFKDVDYEYESSATVAKESVIRFSKTGKAHPFDEIIVYISSGPKEGDIVNVPETLLYITEDEFVAKLKDLGMIASRQLPDYYSAAVKAGGVYTYEDGNFPFGTTIKFSLSRGPYTFVNTDYLNKTKDQVNEMVAGLNKYNARIKVNYEDVATNNYVAGLVYEVSAKNVNNDVVVNCKVAKKDTRVDLPNYVGSYNNPCGQAKSCSLNSINYVIKEVEDGNKTGYISAQSVPAGKVEAGTTVTLTVSIPQPYLYRFTDNYYQRFEGDSVEETSNNLLNNNDALGRFTTVVINTDTSGDYPNGQIVSISTWAGSYWNSEYAAGNYPSDLTIRVVIAQGRLLK